MQSINASANRRTPVSLNVVAHADFIRCIQLGNPETILIDDDGTRERLVEELRAMEDAATDTVPEAA